MDRREAGRALAELLSEYANRSDVIVLALPRGGVPVAYEIATRLSLVLDVFIVRKLGFPGHEEYAMGAIASGGIVVLNESVTQDFNVKQSSIDAVLESEKKELVRREYLYRENKPFPSLLGKTVILVDDGIATGSTMKAAILAIQQKNPTDIIIAVPVAARSTCDEMAALVKTIVCPLQPIDFNAVGLWYNDFSQTTDKEVMELLKKSNRYVY